MITAAQVWQWMPPSAKREGETDANAIMARIVTAVELLWLERWSILLADDEATITAADDLITLTGHGYINGDQVILWDLDDGDPLTDRVYYVRDVTANTFKIATTAGGTVVDITEDGTAKVAPAVRPSYIDQALIMQAAALYNRRQILNGVVAGTETMGPFRVGRFDPDIERLIDDQSWIIG